MALSVRLHSQLASRKFVEALDRLAISVSVFSLTGLILNAINPLVHYKRWRDQATIDSVLNLCLNEKRKQTHPNNLGSEKPLNGDIFDIAFQANDLPHRMILDQLRSIFVAGHDSTAATMSWIYYFLYWSPNALLRIRQEHDEVFGVNTTPADVAAQLIADPKLHIKLEFTLAVVKESLRLEPPASSPREPTKNYHFTTSTGRTYAPPEGSMIYLSAWILHRNKALWGEDAEKFIPQRFMPGRTIPWGYIPFSKRPRDCVGSYLALLECKIILALTIRRFDFEPSIPFVRVVRGTVSSPFWCG